MKRVLSLIAIIGIMASCNNKKEKTEETTTDTTAATTQDPATTTTTTTTVAPGVPTFSDPEVQKFANDYAAFIEGYRTGMADPAKAQELSKQMQEWSTKSQTIGMKLAQNPEEAQKWSEWMLAISRSMGAPTK